MRNVTDTFWTMLEDVKSQCGYSDPIKRLGNSLNRYDHPLKKYDHPYKSYAHSSNSIMNPNRGMQKLRILRDLINEYILGEVSFPKKQSSSRMSTLASKVLNGYKPSNDEIKALAASVLSQDETRGQGFG